MAWAGSRRSGLDEPVDTFDARDKIVSVIVFFENEPAALAFFGPSRAGPEDPAQLQTSHPFWPASMRPYVHGSVRS